MGKGPKWLFAAAFVAVTAWVLSTGAHAGVIFTIANTSVQNCTTGGVPNGSHGLWTNPSNAVVSNTNCGAYFSINPGSTFTFNNDDPNPDNWTGSLVGTATNPNNVNASFNIFLDKFVETYSPFKACAGCSYDPNTDTPDIDFFEHGSGTITIGSTVYTLAQPDPWAGAYAFQFGLGANDKALELGGSAWVNIEGLSHHFDFNLAFKVPEPSTAFLFVFGLIGLGFIARRRWRYTA